MTRRLPPFAAVRAFEAAARHESFTEAAAELNVTQSAISHQVKRLEAFLDARLFRRVPHGVELTAVGRGYLGELSELLDRLDASTRRVRGADRTELLRVRATPAFTTRWLLPRMLDFQAAHPDLDYEVTIGMPPTDLSQNDVDVVVHWGTEPVPGARVEPFLRSARAPVASREFLRAAPALDSPADLLEVTLLHDKVQDGWSAWFQSCGVTPPAAWRGPRFDHCELVLQAAEADLGVALPYTALIQRELESEGLVQLFRRETLPAMIYSLAYRDCDAEIPRVRRFRDWIFDQAADSASPRLRVVAP
ncbi:MAG: transcriptional regulator GcvA [Kiloniellales bacterium]|nr:transcriptional regulator GcvA [Kiloniellales bacterium]